MHVLFTGGGTAGHINPALAVAAHLEKEYPDCKISYIGTKKGMESRLVPLAGYDFYTIEISGFQRRLTLENIKKNIVTAVRLFTSSSQSRKLLKELKPDVVVGTGGYVSGPVLREAAKMGIKTCVHEANAYPGVTVKAVAPLVDKVLLAMEDARPRLKCDNIVLTGNPIRGSLVSITRKEAREKLGIPEDAPVLLSFGGSLGAKVINEAVIDLIKQNFADNKYYHFHGTGSGGYSAFKEELDKIGFKENDKIKVLEYIDNMDVLMAAADLVICRAGAMTVNELQVCAKPSILIPSPYVAENHQFHNAMTLVKVGAGAIIEEKDLTGEKLVSTVNEILFDKERLSKMRESAKSIAINDAVERITDEILKLYNEKTSSKK